MAEFCYECWNELNETDLPQSKYVLSKDLWLCEGCGEYKRVVIREKKSFFSCLFIPFKFIGKILYVLGRIIILPYIIYKYKKGEYI